eukprot:5560848-Prymnesium_polylepis.1
MRNFALSVLADCCMPVGCSHAAAKLSTSCACSQRCVVRCDVSERCGSGSGERATWSLTDAHRSSSRALQLKRLRR